MATKWDKLEVFSVTASTEYASLYMFLKAKVELRQNVISNFHRPGIDRMILEGIVTSMNAEGLINIAPMGPLVDPSMELLRLRPFQSSRTYQNLKQAGQGVFHVIDDVLLMARAAIGELTDLPELFPAEKIRGQVIASTCRWYEFEVLSIDDSQERADINAKVIHIGRRNDFLGFNRAKHAVLEAAIIATRVHIMTRDQIKLEFDRLQIPVQKTAGPKEIEAFAVLREYVNRK